MNSFVTFFSKNKLIKDIFTYGYGTFIAKSVNFFTIPIYTRIFLPEVYGELEYFLIFGALFGALLNVGLDSALSFFYKVEGNFNNRKKTTVSSIFVIITIWGGILFILSSLLINYFESSLYRIKIYYIVGIIFFLESLVSLLLNIFRLEKKSTSYVSFQISNGLISNFLIF